MLLCVLSSRCVKIGYRRHHGNTLLPCVSSQPEQDLLLTFAGSPQKATAIEATAAQVSNAAAAAAAAGVQHNSALRIACRSRFSSLQSIR
jgi:hypothetical protein